MDCLDANEMQDLMSGTLSTTQRTRVLGHLDTCDDCREVLKITASDVARQAVLANAADVGLATTMAQPSEADPISTVATMPPQDLIATPVLRGPVTRPPAEGNHVGRFTLLERIGQGAMGVVWRAEDPKLGRNVAVKILKHADDSLTERLVREARSMAQVNHPNVVTVYEVADADDGTTFIAMELVEGQSLREWQTKRQAVGHVAIPEIVAAYIAAGQGLAAAHAAGLVHRDFKADNVLVGADGRMRVTDFGLAAAKPGEGGKCTQIGDVNLTTDGSVLGTPAYMAPEQFTGGNLDSRTDQFNFCVSLYEALYGERPFEGKSFSELGDNVIYGRIKPPPASSHVSGALRAILLRGLSSKPGDRFATMKDLLRELGRDRATSWRRASIVSAALAAALLLGLVADWIVRDRLSREIDQSFALTGAQLERAVGQLRDQFDTVSQVAYREAALREVAAHHDQADFGLGTPEDDKAELERLHNTLMSTDWVHLDTSTLAIADYKGRLLFTSAAPNEWGGSLTGLPFVKRALDAGHGDSVTVLPYANPALRSSGMFGHAQPPPGLAVVFVRTLALGDKASEGSEARALYLQVQDGERLLDNVRLDPRVKLALVAPTGERVGDAAAVAGGGSGYQVQTRPITGIQGQGTIAHVVMARPLGGVLSLFPGARIVFALAAMLSLAIAGATFWRARGITRGLI